MIFSEPFTQRHRSSQTAVDLAIHSVNAVNPSNQQRVHHRVRHTCSLAWFSIGLLNERFQSVAPAAFGVRRVEAGAGATAVFVAVIRRDTSLARRASLGGRSRTCLDCFMANCRAIRRIS